METNQKEKFFIFLLLAQNILWVLKDEEGTYVRHIWWPAQNEFDNGEHFQEVRDLIQNDFLYYLLSKKYLELLITPLACIK